MPVSLGDIVKQTLRDTATRKTLHPQILLEGQAVVTDRRFEATLRAPTPAVKLITEIKPASPTAGVLKADFELAPILEVYNTYASAISVLTDEKFFNGSLALLSQVVAQSPHPVLCKDFILDPYQVYEARCAGADAVLLIVKILEKKQLAHLHALIEDLGMTPVVEIQNEAELELALTVHPKVLLINNRDLSTFEISLETTQRLAPKIPKDIVVISASGIQTRHDIDTLLPVASCFLIGSALMQAPDLARKLQELSVS